MRAFHYRLEAALRKAERAEQVRQRELADLESKAKQAAERLDVLGERRDRLRARFRALQQEAVKAAKVSASGREMTRLEAILGHAEGVRRELDGHVEAARQRLVEAMQERKLLERHREMLAERHAKAETAEENKRLDEVANMRFAGRPPLWGTEEALRTAEGRADSLPASREAGVT